MTVKECYEVMEGDYEGTFARMMKEDRMKKFLLLFLSDTSYELLNKHIEGGNIEEAFRAAHTLKGVTINLGLSRLNRSSYEVTEILRDGNLEAAKALMPQITEDYQITINAIQQLQAEG